MRKEYIKCIYKIFIVVLFCMTVGVLDLSAQGGSVVKGQVKDSSDAVVVGGTVVLYARKTNIQVTTMTNSEGNYHFKRIAKGDYIVEALGKGFNRSSRTITVEDSDVSVELTLVIAGPSEAVLVTATDTPQTAGEISKAVSVVTSDEIEKRNEFSIAESIRTTPGLRVQQLGGPGTFTQIQTRGLRGSDTAVLVDGIRLRDAAAPQGDATAFIEESNFVSTDRVEIVRGSGSSLYGSNAIGGVINIVSEQGGGPTNGELQFEAGGLGLYRGRGKLAGGFDENRFVYSGGVTLLNVTDGVNDTPVRNFSGQGFAQYSFTPLVTLSTRIYGNTAYLVLTDSPFTSVTALPGLSLPPRGSIISAVPLALDQQNLFENRQPITNRGNANYIANLNDPDSRRDSDFITFAIIFNQRANENFGYRVSYNRVNTNRQFSNGPAGNRFEPSISQGSTSGGRIDTLNIQGDTQLGKNNLLTFGYEFENEEYIGSNFDENPIQTLRTNAGTNVSQRSNTFFIRNQLQLFDDRFQASAAFRWQGFVLRQPVFSGGMSVYTGRSFESPAAAYTGDIAISYFFRESGTKIRAHVGSGYRAPSAFERFGSSFFLGVFSPFGDPRLSPERSIAVDGGIDQGLFKGRVQLSANYFYTRLQEVIVFDFSGGLSAATDPFGRSGGYLNTRGGIARGVELAASAKPYRTLDISGSYTFTKAQNRTATSVPGFLQTFVQPRHTFTLVGTQRVTDRIDVVFDLFAHSSYFFPFSGRAFRFSGPVKADLGGSYTFPLDERRSIRFYGKVENLFNGQYFESGFRLPGAYFVGGAKLRF